MFYHEWFQGREEQIWKDFFAYLAIPSISTDGAYREDVLRAGAFVKGRLERLGMEVVTWDDVNTPVYFAKKVIDPSYPTVLIYGHYDVQPADPLEEWESKPFEPEVRGDKIFARGAEDNKGQNFYSLLAIEAFYEKNPEPKLNVKVIIEGEEEIGSPGFEKLAKNRAKELEADSIWIVDNGIESYEVPQLSLGVRGITAMEVTYSNAAFDLHSGSYGGVVYNPIQALCEVVGSVFDPSGKITIDGFYDGIKPLTPEEKKDLYLETSAETYKKETTASCLREEEGFSLQESVSMRPTFEVNGIFGGYQGEGSKTIIPSSATAKITCRLVEGQDAEDVAKKVASFFEQKAPSGMKVEVHVEGGGCCTWGSPKERSAQIFAGVLEEVIGKPVKFSYAGGSVPLTAHLKEAAGGECVFLGTALPEDRIHSPNENFGKKQFFDGFLMVAKGLEVFAQNKKP